MEAPNDARHLPERSVGFDPIHMIRVHDLTVDVVEDFAASFVNAVHARSAVEAVLLQVDEEGMNAGCPGASWTTHCVVDSHNLFARVPPESIFCILEITVQFDGGQLSRACLRLTLGRDVLSRNKKAEPTLGERASVLRPTRRGPAKQTPDEKCCVSTLAGLHIREARPADAAALLALKRRLDLETAFMLVEPNEPTETEQEVAAALERAVRSLNSVVLLAETERALIGHVEATGGEIDATAVPPTSSSAFWQLLLGGGVGGALLDALDQWAAAAAVHRLELTVMASNQHALRLYERKGFLNEGRRRACLSIGGDSVDEFYMGKVLPFAT